MTAPKRMSGWGQKPNNGHQDKTYRKNRETVRSRDAMCVRCYVLDGVITPGKECDHWTNLAQGGTHDLENLWMLCCDCHRDKTQREANGLTGFSERINPEDGWNVEEPDWAEVIKQRHAAWQVDRGFL